MCNFSRHHKLEAHKKAALLFLGIKADTTLDMKAPTLQQFLDVIDFVAKGNAANQGLDSVGQGKKIKKMAACLAEAMWEQDRICSALRNPSVFTETSLMAGWLSLNHDLSLNLFGLLVRLAVGFVLLLSLRLAVRFCATNKLLEIAEDCWAF